MHTVQSVSPFMLFLNFKRYTNKNHGNNTAHTKHFLLGYQKQRWHRRPGDWRSLTFMPTVFSSAGASRSAETSNTTGLVRGREREGEMREWVSVSTSTRRQQRHYIRRPEWLREWESWQIYRCERVMVVYEGDVCVCVCMWCTTFRLCSPKCSPSGWNYNCSSYVTADANSNECNVMVIYT